MRISDWSSDVCSSDLDGANQAALSGFRIAILPACRSTHIVKPPHHVAGVNVGQREGLRSILGKRLRTPANSARREWLGKSGIVDHAARLSSLIAKPGIARLPRSDERAVGIVCVRTCRSLCWLFHYKKTNSYHIYL